VSLLPPPRAQARVVVPAPHFPLEGWRSTRAFRIIWKGVHDVFISVAQLFLIPPSLILLSNPHIFLNGAQGQRPWRGLGCPQLLPSARRRRRQNKLAHGVKVISSLVLCVFVRQLKLKGPFLMDGKIKDLVSLAQMRATQRFHQEGYTFLRENGEAQTQLTYAEVDQRAQRVAAWLQHHRVARGERVLLLFPPGIDYIAAFWGCLYAGVIAVPIYPPRRTHVNRFARRFYSVIDDAQATVALTTASLHPVIDDMLTRHPQFQSFQVLHTNAIPDHLSWQEVKCLPETIALIQYTP